MAFTQTPSITMRIAIATLAASALVLTGCTTAETPAPVEDTAAVDSTVGTDTDTDTDTDDVATGTPVTANATEFAIELSQTDFTAGTYTFELVNDGSMGHDLVIEGPGVAAASSVAGPGASATVTVDLEPGTYVLYCSIGDHRAMGMEIEITVS